MLTIMVMMVITRGQLMLENMDTTVVLSVRTRRSRSATSIPMRTLARSPKQLARRLLTPSTSRSARRSSTLFVRKLTSSIITVSMLLDMNQMLLLDLLAFMRKFGADVLQHPRGVAVDPWGRIVVVECKVMRVVIFDMVGNVLAKFSCSRHLEFPNGVAVNDNQEVFISDNRAH